MRAKITDVFRANGLWFAAIATIIVFVASWSFGFSALYSAGLAVVVFGVLLALAGVKPVDELTWPPIRPEEAVAQSEVSRMAWSVQLDAGTVGGSALSRVRQMMERTVEVEGLDPQNPDHRQRIDAIFGAGVWDESQQRRISLQLMDHLLNVMENRG